MTIYMRLIDWLIESLKTKSWMPSFDIKTKDFDHEILPHGCCPWRLSWITKHGYCPCGQDGKVWLVEILKSSPAYGFKTQQSLDNWRWPRFLWFGRKGRNAITPLQDGCMPNIKLLTTCSPFPLVCLQSGTIKMCNYPPQHIILEFGKQRHKQSPKLKI